MRSKQYLFAVHLLTYSLLWVRCLFYPSKFGVLGAEWKLFINFCPKIRVSTTIYVSWPNLVKIGRCEVAEKSSGIVVLLTNKKTPASGTCSSPPFRPHLADRAQNFMNVVGPWAVHLYRLQSGSIAVCRTYSGKSPKKSIQYRLKAATQAFSLYNNEMTISIRHRQNQMT